MKDEVWSNPELIWALRSYIADSGRLLMIVLDDQGCIKDANMHFRARLAGFSRVNGEPLSHFLLSQSGDSLTIEAGFPQRTPVAHILKGVSGGEIYVFHAYPIGECTLLIGELAELAENDIIERMGHLAIEMSRLVRDLRKTNHELAEASELNQRLARTDGLTGIANRRYFMERLRTSIAHAQSRRHKLSLVMIDLDHFKKVNDRFGHAGGDAVLLAFAALLQGSSRAGDLPGRLGGEEFAVYLCDTNLPTAVEVAGRWRTQIAELRPLDADYRITASFGVTELIAGDSSESLLQRADDLLYQAKTQGRNQVVAVSA